MQQTLDNDIRHEFPPSPPDCEESAACEETTGLERERAQRFRNNVDALEPEWFLEGGDGIRASIDALGKQIEDARHRQSEPNA